VIVVISGTNRPQSNTRKVTAIVLGLLEKAGAETRLLDLHELPREIFDASSYARKPAAFAPWQEAIFAACGILTVLPEYNGACPGVLKYFIDMLKFPESLRGVPAAFIGLGAGEWGGLRAVEQIELVFQYRSAHLYGRRVFLKHVNELLDAGGGLKDPALLERLEGMVAGFVDFSRRLEGGG
jgi:NAD(P)H-dependent FMN reductase